MMEKTDFVCDTCHYAGEIRIHHAEGVQYVVCPQCDKTIIINAN